MRVAYSSPDDLPACIPVFPLSDALLLPRGQLPLNIFEPRYLAMIDDCLRGERLIGMIQPFEEDAATEKPKLFTVGCLGRLTQYAETDEGQLQIVLTGISRFKIVEEIATVTPYRQFSVSYSAFTGDFTARTGEDEVNREAVIDTLARFAKAASIRVDWNGIREANTEALVNALAMMSPYSSRDKQALLEAVTLRDRADLLVAITEFELARRRAPNEAPVQ